TADRYLLRGQGRIGRLYHKTIYYEYTDNTYTTEVIKPPYQGLLGPTIRAEVGDIINLHFYNNASRNFSTHAHGLFYLKGSEGALYLDETSGLLKEDDHVMPGQRILQKWVVTENDAPTPEDPNCIPSVYHSHIFSKNDIPTGLFGVIAVCKKGVLDSSNRRTDVDIDIPLVVMNWDENLSNYILENIDLYCGDPDLCRRLLKVNDPDFIESNLMKSINGRGLFCVGDKVAFYVVGFGNEKDVHSMYFHGQNLKFQGKRGDTIPVYSATFVAAETTPTNPGKWLLVDFVDDHQKEGIAAFYNVRNCPENPYQSSPSYGGETREYFLQTEELDWDYGPTGYDARTGLALLDKSSSSFMFFVRNATRFGGVYKKAQFVQYTDSYFKTRVTRSAKESYLGVMGPVLRVEVGDRLVVTLKNYIPYPVSFLPHGMRYDFSEEAKDGPGVPGGKVGYNQVHTYTFDVPTNLLEGSKEPCVSFLYTSSHDVIGDHNAGLVGPLLVCQTGYLASPYKPLEFFVLLATFDENKSLFKLPKPEPGDAIPYLMSNMRSTVNGYSYGNMPEIKVCVGDDVIWHVMNLGSFLDVNTIVFDGNTFDEEGTHRDAKGLIAGVTASLYMKPDNPGRWMLYSQTTTARDNGMFAFYTALDCDGQIAKYPAPYGKVREYYIAAEEVYWDYSPLMRSVINGADLNDPSTEGHIFVFHNNYFIGHVYKKAVFREYTDKTFKVKKPGRFDILGTALKAEVGDVIKITFYNKASRRYSIHSHGVMTSQKDNGGDYGSSVSAGPGETVTYTWMIPARSGPGPNDPNCIPWVYYSGVDTVKDANSGLVGSLVVCKSGILDQYSVRKDVNTELYVYMSIINENLSWYLDENVRLYAPGRVGTNYLADPNFVESNKMHAINGKVFGNTNNLVVSYGDKVAFYMLSLGAELDLHTMHTHGHTFVHTSEKHRDDVAQIFPGMAESVEVIADNPGHWLIHCHVMDHMAAGMETPYTVLPPPGQKNKYSGTSYTSNSLYGSAFKSG
ncbi:ferroxidase HEPHL1-like, partial [Physella acuta]|uniref:ferroxidase HEPHL1-like n=1 Tax=Physella acuta TaxID=109671 RepID=UPI0027DB86BD